MKGLVIKAHSGFFTLHRLPDGAQFVARAAGRLTKGKHVEDALAVGDRVTFEVIQSGGPITARIIEVEPRARTLSRHDPIIGSAAREIRQVIVANPDLAVFVFACAEPEFTPRLLDRYLVGAEAQRLPVLICASKIDLVGPDQAKALFAEYERIGYCVIYTSAVTGQGIDELRAALHGKLSVLTGKSGVGKSSLLNALKPGLGLAVGEISSKWRKGKHTTVVPELVRLDENSWIADTPGLRAYSIWDVTAEELDAYYREIAPWVSRCAFSDCTHIHESDCAVKAAVARGEISQARYESYCRLREELSQQRRW
ncbi:MAG: ribosome small subunit-dependent GTPase A [Anaerolineae bacterium]|nr:ribosome small subunit-dependent GTPase A [Thermoflexales bacterium]MDW8406599.1 ribosome small subunit-dependent GTPase A [Anaerolineae bacterium]